MAKTRGIRGKRPESEETVPILVPSPGAVPGGADAPRCDGQRRLCELSVAPSEIARAVNVSRPMITYWRTGQKVPNPERRAQLERLYGIPAVSWDRVAEAYVPPPEGCTADPSIALQPLPKGMTLVQVEAMLERLQPVVMAEDLPPSTLAQIMSTVTALLRLKAALAGDARSDEQKLAQSPAYQMTMAAVLDALTPHPLALRAVERALSRLVSP